MSDERDPDAVFEAVYTHAYLGVSSGTLTLAIAEPRVSTGHAVSTSTSYRAADQQLAFSVARRDNGEPMAVVSMDGDSIVGIGGTRIDTRQELSTYLTLEVSPGETVDVTVLRNGNRRTFQVTLGKRPNAKALALQRAKPSHEVVEGVLGFTTRG